VDTTRAVDNRRVATIRKFWAPFLGGLLVVVGVIVVRVAPASFGWFAYAPLSSSESLFFPTFPSPWFYGGAALAIAGLLLIAGWIGFLLGPRRDVR